MHLCWTALIYHPNMQSETICDCTAPPQNSFQLISAGVFGRRQSRSNSALQVKSAASDQVSSQMSTGSPDVRHWEDGRGTVMVANRTREMRLSGMTRGANHGRG
jgi:hypothetical protein